MGSGESKVRDLRSGLCWADEAVPVVASEITPSSDWAWLTSGLVAVLLKASSLSVTGVMGVGLVLDTVGKG